MASSMEKDWPLERASQVRREAFAVTDSPLGREKLYELEHRVKANIERATKQFYARVSIAALTLIAAAVLTPLGVVAQEQLSPGLGISPRALISAILAAIICTAAYAWIRTSKAPDPSFAAFLESDFAPIPVEDYEQVTALCEEDEDAEAFVRAILSQGREMVQGELTQLRVHAHARAMRAREARGLAFRNSLANGTLQPT